MMRRALNTLDYRLIDHGERIAYLVWKILEHTNCYTREQLLQITYLALFHDIGAYKTEDLDSLSSTDTLFQFEIGNTIEHSISGYLFLRQHEFFVEYADAVLYHHFYYDRLVESRCKNQDIAATIFIADRLDMLIMKNLVREPEDAFQYLNNAVFSQKEVAILEKLQEENQIIQKCMNRLYLEEFLEFMQEIPQDENKMKDLIHILPHAIDFRSEYTVTHTAATVKISMLLADFCGLSRQEIEEIYLGALLHDVGKIAISHVVLEKDSALSSYEFKYMKDHVILTEYILNGCVSDTILCIAARHHEKLDGSGYPKGLTGKELTLSQRIVAVGDILSALMGKRSYKEPFLESQVKEIIIDMADKNKLCSYVVEQAILHYKELEDGVAQISKVALEAYQIQQMDTETLLEEYRNL